MDRIALSIEGMDCGEEVAALQRRLGPIAGIKRLSFDILNARMVVDYDSQTLNVEEILGAIKQTGMAGRLIADSDANELNALHNVLSARTILTIASGVALLLGLTIDITSRGVAIAIAEGGAPPGMVVKGMYCIATLLGTWLVLPKAWISFRQLRPDMNLLMCLAVAGALGIGEWFEAATVAFLFALSIALESWSVGRARRAVTTLMALSPTTARVINVPTSPDDAHHGCCHLTEGVDPRNVVVGSMVLVKPGEKFPLDGTVFKGETQVNQAPITGESMPVPKSPGDDVFAGTINGDGTVEVVTTKEAADGTISRIVKLVSEAQARRSTSEVWVERFARVYTPAVVLLALSVMTVPPLLLKAPWETWFYQGLVLLVIACPCALVISTPVSIVAALTAAAKHGVLIKGGIFVELPARLKAVALDKTGTLTEGKPEVREIIPLSGHTEREVLEIAAAMEGQSEHPLAGAVMRHAKAQNISVERAQSFVAIKGKGARGTLNGAPVWLGSHRYLEERAQETPEMHATLEACEAADKSVIVVGNDEHVCGFISVADSVRPQAGEVIADLKAEGIVHIAMLTGDNQKTASSIARETQIDEVRAELLPEDKVAVIEELVQHYGQVAMVGDGVNDAPAMARATLGIAMGAAGTDAAIETADIALMSDDLSKLPWLIRHSRRSLAIIRQNVFLSLGVKLTVVLLTVGGHASLWAAIASDMGVSLLVVFNALRLLGISR